jgi:hypothetical protein
MEKLCGRPVAGKLDVRESDVKSTAYATDVKHFTAKILESQH